MTARSLLELTPVIVLVACLGLVLLIVATKVARSRRERRSAELVAPYRRDLLAVASGEDDDGVHRGRLLAARGASQTAVDEALSHLLGKVRGVPADHLAEVLRAHGAVDRAMEDLGHRSSVRRARAAQLLGLCQVDSALRGLLDALDDPTAQVRASAAHALGLIGDAAAGPSLLSALGSQRPIPAGAAADALEGLGTGISDALRDALHDPSPTARTVAAHLSGAGAFTRSTPRLRELLADDPEPTVREAAADALAHLGRTEDVEALARHAAANQPMSLRRACVRALGELGEPSAAPHLLALVDDTDARLAELAASALLCLGPVGREALGDREGPAAQTARAVAALQAGRRPATSRASQGSRA